MPIASSKNEFKKGFMGKPTFHMEVAILNEDDEECATGEPGQICFRAHLPYTIFKEYYGKPEATVEAFRHHWFHSGDAGYIDEDGYYYFIDRMSGRIRRRGENISSYQIEDIVNSHPSVSCCAAFPIPAEEGDEDEIVVYVMPQAGEVIQEAQLRQWVEAELPKFMWPQYIKLVEDLPRTPTNKVEKYKLKEMILNELKLRG